MKSYYLKTKDIDEKGLKDLEEIRNYVQNKYNLICKIVVREYI